MIDNVEEGSHGVGSKFIRPISIGLRPNPTLEEKKRKENEKERQRPSHWLGGFSSPTSASALAVSVSSPEYSSPLPYPDYRYVQESQIRRSILNPSLC